MTVHLAQQESYPVLGVCVLHTASGLYSLHTAQCPNEQRLPE